MVLYLLELRCQFGKRLDYIISNWQANACLCVCDVCDTYVSLCVSSSWQPHTASSTQIHRTPQGERARTRGRRPLLLPTFPPIECIGCITHMQNASTGASHTNTINTKTLTKQLQPCTTNKHRALSIKSHKTTVPLFPKPLHVVGAYSNNIDSIFG